MPTTGFVNGSAATLITATNLTYSGATTYVNILDQDDDTISATTTSKNATATIEVGTFGFDSLIPSGSQIDSVNLRVRGSATAAASVQAGLIRIGTTDGTELSIGAFNAALQTADETGYARPGGGTWTRADLLNASLKVRVRSLQPNNTTSRTYAWAYVAIEVVYSAPSHESAVSLDATADIATAGEVETPSGAVERSASIDAVASIATVGGIAVSYDQAGFRAYADDGAINAATPLAAENTAWTPTLDTNFRFRAVIDEGGGPLGGVLDFKLQYSKNGGAWTDVNLTSLVVRTFASPIVANNAATTRQLTSGTGTFVAGTFDENNGAAGSASTIDNGELTEIEWCAQVRSADVTNGDTVQLRAVETVGTVPFASYTQVPTLTISGGPTTLERAASLDATAAAEAAGQRDLLRSASLDAVADIATAGTASTPPSATVAFGNAVWASTNTAVRTVAVTPAVGDLLVAVAGVSGGIDGFSSITDDQSGTYTKIPAAEIANAGNNNNHLAVWIRDQLVSTATSHTLTTAGVAASGGGLAVYIVSGISRTGSSAARAGGGATGAISTTPTATLGLTPQTVNPIIGGVTQSSSTANIVTPRSGYTEGQESQYTTPSNSLETMSRNSGETSASIAWGNAASAAWQAVAVEIDTSVGAATHSRAAALDASAGIATAGQRDLLRATSLDAAASIATAGMEILLRSTSLDAAADISVSGQIVGGPQTHQRSASLDAAATIAVVPQRVLFRAVGIDGTATIVVVGQRVLLRAVGLDATAQIETSGQSEGPPEPAPEIEEPTIAVRAFNPLTTAVRTLNPLTIAATTQDERTIAVTSQNEQTIAVSVFNSETTAATSQDEQTRAIKQGAERTIAIKQ
jgi:hypothetical protein